MDKVRRKQQKQQKQQRQLPAIGDEDEEQEEGKAASRSPMVAAASSSGAAASKKGAASTPSSSSTCSKPYFGVRSYLHKFYENACTASDLEDYEEDSCSLQGTHTEEMIKPRSGCCQQRYLIISLLVGMLALLAGLGLLLVGFAFPRMPIDLGYQEEMRIIDRRAVAFNEHLELLKLLGLVVFAMGGAVVAAALLLPSLLGAFGGDGTGDQRSRGSSEDFDGGEEHFKVRVVHEEHPRSYKKVTSRNGGAGEEEDDDPEEEEEEEEAEDATRRLIPVEEQLSAVQPKAEPGGHIVATLKKAGLKTIN